MGSDQWGLCTDRMEPRKPSRHVIAKVSLQPTPRCPTRSHWASDRGRHSLGRGGGGHGDEGGQSPGARARL